MKNVLIRILQKLKNESGAVSIIEATLVFPIVFVIIGFLIVTSFYQLQKSALQSDAQRIALAISRSKAIPEYSYFGAILSKKIDFETLPEYYPEYPSTNGNLYRYLTTQIENKKILTKQMNELIQCNAFLAGPKLTGTVECINASFPFQTVIVEISCPIYISGLLNYFGLSKLNFMKVTGEALVADSAEFVRNTDMVFDATAILKNQTQTGKDFNAFISEICKTINKWKDGGL